MTRFTLTALCMLISGFINVNAHHTVINNNITEVTEVTEVYDYSTNITEGVSDSDLAKGLSMSAASGAHQFDFSTTDWQGSVTGAFYENDEAISVGVGKKFEQFGAALLHLNFTQKSDKRLWVIGGTFRF